MPEDRLVEFLRQQLKKVQDAWEATGEQAVEFTREEISVAVEHLDDGTVIRSSPGQPPRKDTGELYDNVEHNEFIEGEEVVLTVSSSRPSQPEVPSWMEYGAPGQNKPRPYMKKSFEETHPKAYNDAVAALKD